MKNYGKAFFVFVISLIGWIAFIPTIEAVEKQEMNQYVSITTSTFKLYQDLNKTEEKQPSVQKNQTFLVKESYREGIITYLALYDTTGFKGFINEEDVTEATGPEGIEKIIRDYVVIVKNVPVYKDFDWQTDKKTKVDKTKVYKVKRAFYHYNGHVYLSLFDDQNKWLGYVDQEAVKNTKKQTAVRTSEALKETDRSKEDTNVVKTRTSTPKFTSTIQKSHQTKDELSNYFIGGVTEKKTSEEKPDSTIQKKDISSVAISSSWPSHQAFIEAIGPEAKKIADKNDLFPSVMIAQAILESGYGQSRLAKEANNLFGIKYTASTDQKKYGHYEIASNEFVNGKMELLPASFRKYDFLADSLQDNADLLKKGLSGNPFYYKGTWREKAETYQEATKALTGKYATDPEYDTKLNKVISDNQLTQYDN